MEETNDSVAFVEIGDGANKLICSVFSSRKFPKQGTLSADENGSFVWKEAL